MPSADDKTRTDGVDGLRARLLRSAKSWRLLARVYAPHAPDKAREFSRLADSFELMVKAERCIGCDQREGATDGQ